jgi:hypothetical protein
MNKQSINKIAIFTLLFLVGGLIAVHSALAQSCPENTVVGETTATLVGEITDDGGDPNLTVWFQYGKTNFYGLETSRQSKYGTGRFCIEVENLSPCTLYHFRAVAQNSAGTSYGEDKTFTTICGPTVDLKANGSNGPITLYYQDYVTLSWTSRNAVSCTASEDWSGSKPTSGSETKQLNVVKTYTFTITCQNSSGQTGQDSVQVVVKPKPPVVITKPAVVTL